ncbi:MAG: NAD(P)/FAD-dependent oxidoreductase [Acidobacteriota bacterium]
MGGGPAGAAAGAHLARRGRRVLIAERERFPRFHIGESLIPEANRYLERIGVLDKVASQGFPVKQGAILLAADGEHQSYVNLSEAEGVAHSSTWSTTWEVPRHRFDQLLLDHAAESGAEVWQRARVSDVDLGSDGNGTGDAVEVTLKSEAFGERTVRSRILIDASGRDGFLAKRLKLRRFDPELRHVGIHAWFEGVVPPPPDCSGDARLISLERDGWAWLIPLDDRVTSVGVVVSRRKHATLPTDSPERCLEILLADVPVLRPLLANARRTSEVRVDGDYSYSTRAYAGDRWLLAGDAGSFLDPVFSTGVLLALAGGVEAAEAVDRCLSRPRDGRRRPLVEYDREQRRKYRFFRRFVTGFYRPEFRDILLQPGDPYGLSAAVVTVLAGSTRPSLSTRIRLEIFFALVALQRHVRIVPRLHGRPEPSGEGSDRGSEGASSSARPSASR